MYANVQVTGFLISNLFFFFFIEGREKQYWKEEKGVLWRVEEPQKGNPTACGRHDPAPLSQTTCYRVLSNLRNRLYLI